MSASALLTFSGISDASCHRSAKGKLWGSDEVNVEGWKPLKRLPGHESGRDSQQFSNLTTFLTIDPDVTDLAWAPGDRFLASVGLDSRVLIWCGYTLGMSPFLLTYRVC